MGNLTAKTSGEIASFMTPAKTNIKSLKVHFSPKQLGTGDPSPENIREIEGWDGVEVAKSSVNLLDQSYIIKASGWVLSSDNDNTMYCGVPVYKGNINKFYTKFKSGYPFIGNPFKENVQYNVSAWLKTVSGNSIQGLKFGFKYTDGTTSLGGIFSANDTWKRQTVTSKANKTVSGIYCSYNSSGEIYLCGLAVCEKEFDDINIVHSSTANDISYQWKKLPDEYQEVEYIESTGTQYIDTGIVLNNGCVITLDFLITGSSVNRVIYGWRRKNKYTDPYQAYIGANASKIRYVAIGKSSDIDSPSSLYGHAFEYGVRNKVLIDSADEQVLVNNLVTDCGEDFSNGKAFNESGSSEFHPYLFALNNAGSPFAISGDIKLYAYSVQYEDESLQTFIPCYRKSDGEIGMYDTVSQKFFTNQGTGTFLKGSDVDKTFYSGYVDLISGELVETYALFDAYQNRSLFTQGNDNIYIVNNQFATYGFVKPINKNESISTHFKAADITTESYPSFSVSNIGHFALRGIPNVTNTVEHFTVYLEEQMNNNTPVQFVMPLATPITHQLTPTQLSSFIGQNNFWSNADYVEIEYELKETEDIQKCRKKIILNQPHIESVKGDLVNFTTNMKAPLKECKVYFEPIQEGEGDPSPDNVRPISGWTEMEIQHTKENLFDPNEYLLADATKVEDAEYPDTYTGNKYRFYHLHGDASANLSATGLIPMKPYGQLTISYYKYYTPSDRIYFHYTDAEAWVNHTGNITTEGYKSYTSVSNRICDGVALDTNQGSTATFKIGALQIKVGDKTTEYEPYQGHTIPINWQSETGIVYGGMLDVLNGKLMVTNYYCTPDNATKIRYGINSESNLPYAYFSFAQKATGYGLSAATLCSMYKAGNVQNVDKALRMWTSEADIWDSNLDVTSLDTVKAYFADLIIVYPLAEPITIQLTPQQLLTLKGTNNIWSNSNGQTEVKFWTHIHNESKSDQDDSTSSIVDVGLADSMVLAS